MEAAVLRAPWWAASQTLPSPGTEAQKRVPTVAWYPIRVSAAPGPKLSHLTDAKTEAKRGQQTSLQSHSE